MASLTEVINNKNVNIDVVILPLNSKVRTEYTFTADGGGSAITAGATSIPLDPVSTVALYAGEKLSFGSVEVTLTADAALGASSLSVVATTGDIPDDTIATTFAMRRLTGADNAPITVNSEEVDISTYGDGLTMQNLKVSAGWSVDLGGVYVKNPAMQEVIQPLGGNGALADREAYIVINRGDGSSYEGAVLVTNYSEDNAFRNVLRFSCTLRGQGDLTYNAGI